MTKRMLIDGAHPEETRVVIVDGNQLEDFDYESTTRQTLKGNIYLGKVTRVEPSLQACFVEYGGNRHGFLPFGEIHPDYYRIPMADREALKAAEAAAMQAAEAREDRRAAEAAAAEAAHDRGETIASDDDHPHDDSDTIEEVGGHVAEQHDDEEPAAAEAAPAPAETPHDEAPAPEAAAPADAAPEAEQDAPEPAGGDDEDDHRRRVTRMRRNYTIQEVIKRRQIVLVQVVKEERGNKGAALTTYISLAGRYCVLMPNTTSGGGISRKITNAQDRKRLKEIVDDLDVPPGMAVILRTAGLERTKTEIKRDYEFLMKVWDEIAAHTLESRAPALIHEEANLIKRTIRDSYGKDVEEVLVDGEDAYRVAKGFMRALMPSHAKKVQLYKDGPTPLFTRFGVESQLDALHATTVRLPSGGYIVINTTEALVAIDVNSGRATRERGIEETAFKTNMEAATAVARQLRLRDLAGLIVIDFIDMEDRRNNAAVERRIKEAMKADRARLQIGRISGFGLLELSRQRLRPSLFESSTHVCPHCAGTGYMRSVDSSGLAVLRAIEEEAVTGRHAEVSVHVATPIALYLLNQKRDALNRIARDHGMDVWVEADDTLLPPAHRLTGLRAKVARDPDDEDQAPIQGVRSLPPPAVTKRSMVEDDAADAEAEQAEAALEERDQRDDRHAQETRSRDGRNRDRGRDNRNRDVVETGETDEAGAEPDRDAEARNPAETEEESRNRRRRGRRGGRRRGRQPGDDQAERNEQPQQADAAPDSVEPAPAVAEDAAPETEGSTAYPAEGQSDDRPRRRRRRGGRNWRNDAPADLAAVPDGAPPTDDTAPGGIVSDTVRAAQAMMEAAAGEAPVAAEVADAEPPVARAREATSEEAASWEIAAEPPAETPAPADSAPDAVAAEPAPVADTAAEPVPEAVAEAPAEAAVVVAEPEAPAAKAPRKRTPAAPKAKAPAAAKPPAAPKPPKAAAAAKPAPADKPAPAPRVRKPRMTKAAAAAAAAAAEAEAAAAAQVPASDLPVATEAEPASAAAAISEPATESPVVTADAPVETPAPAAPEPAAEAAPAAEPAPAPEPEEPREKRRGWWNRLVS